MEQPSENRNNLRNKFEDYEYTPKNDLFGQIHGGLNSEKEAFLAEKFDNYQVEANERNWHEIEKVLHPKKRRAIIWWTFGAAASIAILMMLWNPEFNNSESAPQLVNSEESSSTIQPSQKSFDNPKDEGGSISDDSENNKGNIAIEKPIIRSQKNDLPLIPIEAKNENDLLATTSHGPEIKERSRFDNKRPDLSIFFEGVSAGIKHPDTTSLPPSPIEEQSQYLLAGNFNTSTPGHEQAYPAFAAMHDNSSAHVTIDPEPYADYTLLSNLKESTGESYFPLIFSTSLIKKLSRRISFEHGITYTSLLSRSKSELSLGEEKISRTKRYIGAQNGLIVHLLDREKFDLGIKNDLLVDISLEKK